MRRIHSIFSVLAAIFLLSHSGIVLGQSQNFNTAKSLEVQYNILRVLESQYVDSLDMQDIVYTGINAMLRKIDPYTVFIPEENEEDLDILTTGSYGGVGAIISKLDSVGIQISQPYEGSAAVKFGLEPGDVILTIDGQPTKDMTVSDASSRMRGKPGAVLNMKICKGRSGDTVDVALVRERIHVPDVVYYGMLNDTTGYLQLGGFTSGGSNDVRKAFKEMKGKGMQKFILDLRSNGGGLMAEAVELLSVFLPKGTMVVSARGRDSLKQEKIYTSKEPEDTLMPMIVLVNSESASSSEIVAGALQDLDRAVIAGARTFGKGLVQSVRNVGYGSSLKVTTAKYYTPSGRCVQAIDYSNRNEDGSVGVIPDSLKHEFKTVSGRSVYDGGGIAPDVELEQEKFNRPLVALYYSGIMNEYAIRYYKENETIAPASEFSMTDAEYEDFVKFASSKEFDSRSEAEIMMEEVIKSAERDGMFEDLQDELKTMKEKLTVKHEDFLVKSKDQIKPLLEQEIVQKYYYTRGRAENALRHDKELSSVMSLSGICKTGSAE